MGGWGGVCKVIFVSNPTSVLRLCCAVVGVVTISCCKKGVLLANFFFQFTFSLKKSRINDREETLTSLYKLDMADRLTDRKNN